MLGKNESPIQKVLCILLGHLSSGCLDRQEGLEEMDVHGNVLQSLGFSCNWAHFSSWAVAHFWGCFLVIPKKLLLLLVTWWLVPYCKCGYTCRKEKLLVAEHFTSACYLVSSFATQLDWDLWLDRFIFSSKYQNISPQLSFLYCCHAICELRLFCFMPQFCTCFFFSSPQSDAASPTWTPHGHTRPQLTWWAGWELAVLHCRICSSAQEPPERKSGI